MQTIVFTGGGSAGHVTPNLALIARLRSEGWNVEYVGSADGIEQKIVADFGGVPFHPVSSGKLRRYFDLKNFKDPFKVVKGVWEAYRLVRKLRPRVIFSKGGFVSVPVVIGGWLNKVPVIIHESDMTPGLANRLSIPFARKVCVTFPETLKHFKDGKAVLSGLPIREELLDGNADRGRRMCDFYKGKPVLFIMGGSLGAKAINEALRKNLTAFLKHFQIVHICGKGHLDPALAAVQGYRQFEYVGKELPDLMAMADMVVSRAGATSLCEFLALQKPMLLIPLTLQASRGDQILNAESFARLGYARVLYEEQLTAETLLDHVQQVWKDREASIEAMKRSETRDSLRTIVGLLEAEARTRG